MKSSLTNFSSKSHFIFFELESLQFSFMHVTSLDKKFSFFRKPSFSSLFLSPILFFPLPETNFYMQRLCLRILKSGKGGIRIHKEFFFVCLFCFVLFLSQKSGNYEDYFFNIHLSRISIMFVCLFVCF